MAHQSELLTVTPERRQFMSSTMEGARYSISPDPGPRVAPSSACTRLVQRGQGSSSDPTTPGQYAATWQTLDPPHSRLLIGGLSLGQEQSAPPSPPHTRHSLRPSSSRACAFPCISSVTLSPSAGWSGKDVGVLPGCAAAWDRGHERVGRWQRLAWGETWTNRTGGNLDTRATTFSMFAWSHAAETIEGSAGGCCCALAQMWGCGVL